MKSKIVENIIVIPLVWLSREEHLKFRRNECNVIPIPGYRETNGYRAFKVIGPYNGDIWFIQNGSWWIRNLSIPIWGDWKLTAYYITSVEINNSTTGQQMFDHLEDDEKIQALKYAWYPITVRYIKRYFREHPELLDRARHSLNPKDIHLYFKDLFGKC